MTPKRKPANEDVAAELAHVREQLASHATRGAPFDLRKGTVETPTRW